jgi:hypothetical protein
MRIDTQTFHSLAVQSFVQSQPRASAGASADAMPERALGARLARWVPMVATVLVATTAVLLASGLAIVMSLS